MSMTRHRDIVPLGGMLDTSHRLMSITANKSRADFDADEQLQDALTHLLQRIGRAAERVSDEARSQHPEIDWPQVVSLQTRVTRLQDHHPQCSLVGCHRRYPPPPRSSRSLHALRSAIIPHAQRFSESPTSHRLHRELE